VSQGEYYRAVAGLLRAWIAGDAEALGVVLTSGTLAPRGTSEPDALTCPMGD
jgi:hypothetical protein